MASVVAAQAGRPDQCLRPPPVDPTKDFLGNFNNSCYAIPLLSSSGKSTGGDLNARYARVYYQVTPGYELVVAGFFPQSRFFSVIVYDSHAVETSGFLDNQIAPLTSWMSNPFLPHTPFAANQQYGVTVGFGGSQPVNVTPGCSTRGSTIDQNFLDASQIHQGLTWTGYPGLPANFPPHQTGPNSGGAVIVRSYANISAEPVPVAIVRSLADGCALTASQAMLKSVVSTEPIFGARWSNSEMVRAHYQFSNQIKPLECFSPDPNNEFQWIRGSDYVPGDNNDAGYLDAGIASSLVKSLIAGQQFIRMQFQLPSMPNTPCASGGCSLTGSEQLRYRSISFQNKLNTLASIDDRQLVKDANGNVTLIIGLGAAPPPTLTAAYGYTYFDLSQEKNYKDLSAVIIRDIIPNSAFHCSSFNVPNLTTEFNPAGGYMGNYVPIVDYPTAGELPLYPAPVMRPNTCDIVPTQTPAICGTKSDPGGN